MTSMTATTPSKKPFPDFVNEFFSSKNFPATPDKHLKTVSDLINGYVMGRRPDCFGGTKFFTFFGVDIGNPVLPYDEFVFWWTDLDAVDVAEKVDTPRRNYETHKDPMFRPQSIKGQPYNLETVADYAAKPLGTGHPMTIVRKSEAFQQLAKTPAGPSCWLVPRNEVIAKDLSYTKGTAYIHDLNTKNGAKYELETAVVDLATIAELQRVSKGEGYFGNPTSPTNPWTYARSGDLVCIENNLSPSVIGGSPPSGEDISVLAFDNCDYPDIGVVALRKFFDPSIKTSRQDQDKMNGQSTEDSTGYHNSLLPETYHTLSGEDQSLQGKNCD